MANRPLRFDRAGNVRDSAEDKILMWVSFVVVLAVAIGAVLYGSFGLDSAAQPRQQQWTSTAQPLSDAAVTR
jgi:hypothetical protein